MGTSSKVAGNSEREVVITRIFDAPRSLVFKAWTEPEHLAKWFGPQDFTATIIQSDLRTGGAYHFHMRGPNYDDHWKGTYREVVPPERLAFTWPAGSTSHPLRPTESIVTVTFEDLSGKTKLTLRHGMFETVAQRDDHQRGWNSTLDCLAEHLKVVANE
jgi:uncharacterized protein YndB with AHSA1/START domain